MLSPLEIVEGAYRAWGDDDFVEVLCALDPDIRWHQEDGLPYAGDHVGREAVAQLLRDILSDWDHLDIEPRTFKTSGGLVAVFGAYEAEGKVTGFRFHDRFVHLWSVEGSRISRSRLYRNAAHAMRDLDAMSTYGAWDC